MSAPSTISALWKLDEIKGNAQGQRLTGHFSVFLKSDYTCHPPRLDGMEQILEDQLHTAQTKRLGLFPRIWQKWEQHGNSQVQICFVWRM